jgi:hypothetical protein
LDRRVTLLTNVVQKKKLDNLRGTEKELLITEMKKTDMCQQKERGKMRIAVESWYKIRKISHQGAWCVMCVERCIRLYIFSKHTCSYMVSVK